MPKRGAFALVMTALAVVLLLNFRTPEELSRVTAGTGRPGISGTATVPGTVGSTTAGSQSFTGPVVGTRFGSVQVEITVANAQLVDVTAIELPAGDRRSARISSQVEPTLRSQALQAQSAAIDGVSGATYTSDAYAQSLQAALDSAGL